MKILKFKIISKKNYNKLINELEKAREKNLLKQKSIKELQQELRDFKDLFNIPYGESFKKYRDEEKKIFNNKKFKKYKIPKEVKWKKIRNMQI